MFGFAALQSIKVTVDGDFGNAEFVGGVFEGALHKKNASVLHEVNELQALFAGFGARRGHAVNEAAHRRKDAFSVAGASFQEHGIITLPADTLLKLSDFPVGTRLRILPNHACPTAAPYEKLLLVNGEGRITEALDHVRGW